MEEESKILGLKEIKEGYSFNVAVATPYGYIYLIGMRVWRGYIMPPASKRGNSYYPSLYTGRDFAEWVYQQLIDHFPHIALKEKDMCTNPLIMDLRTYATHFEKPS